MAATPLYGAMRRSPTRRLCTGASCTAWRTTEAPSPRAPRWSSCPRPRTPRLDGRSKRSCSAKPTPSSRTPRRSTPRGGRRRGSSSWPPGTPRSSSSAIRPRRPRVRQNSSCSSTKRSSSASAWTHRWSGPGRSSAASATSVGGRTSSGKTRPASGSRTRPCPSSKKSRIGPPCRAASSTSQEAAWRASRTPGFGTATATP
mmetsp:Transcript_93612/g.286418  ORF Transcript_93612/g.286418 Transcript_93612/m.286418 type:complete len:201 (+) Transcript_93612:215-817(+)